LGGSLYTIERNGGLYRTDLKYGEMGPGGKSGICQHQISFCRQSESIHD
jgi:hypothetical protein